MYISNKLISFIFLCNQVKIKIKLEVPITHVQMIQKNVNTSIAGIYNNFFQILFVGFFLKRLNILK